MTLACRLDVLDVSERRRPAELRRAIDRATQAVRALPDGSTLDLGRDPAILVIVAEWMTLERWCSPFLDVNLDWREREGASLRLTGESGVTAFFAAEFGMSMP